MLNETINSMQSSIKDPFMSAKKRPSRVEVVTPHSTKKLMIGEIGGVVKENELNEDLYPTPP